MLEFLLFLNQMGVTHGDIKPENMLHEASGDGIKFADFGLSHCLSVEGKPKRGGGTYSYMAPEIALGYDHHSSADVWSVGCVLVECLTKKKLFCSRSAPELLRAVTRIVGSPSQRAIANAPRRCRFYWHNDNSGLWILDGSRELAVPIGLRRYLQIFHGVRVDDLKCTAFIDLVEGMLRLDPSKRSGPEALLAHPFFTVDGTALDRAELARLREICTRLDLSTGALCEAVRLYEGIKVEPAIRGREKAAVILACLYVACLRRKEVVSKRKFAKASGLDVRYVDFMSKTILEVSGLTVQPPTRKWDIYECLRPIVDWLAS